MDEISIVMWLLGYVLFLLCAETDASWVEGGKRIGYVPFVSRNEETSWMAKAAVSCYIH